VAGRLAGLPVWPAPSWGCGEKQVASVTPYWHHRGMHFVCVFGPPAVGKMTVGRALCELTGFKLFHNHMTVEPVSEIFDFGTAPFCRLVGEFRRRVVEEAVAADLAGLVFTYVWGLEEQGDADLIASLLKVVDGAGGSVHFVELAAPLAERRRRNVTELRREHKRTHRDAELSEWILHDLERYQLNTTPGEPLPEPAAAVLAGRDHVRIDNTDLGPEEVARRVIAAFDLPEVRPTPDGAAPAAAAGRATTSAGLGPGPIRHNGSIDPV
jgi:hypothetical protein